MMPSTDHGQRDRQDRQRMAERDRQQRAQARRRGCADAARARPRTASPSPDCDRGRRRARRAPAMARPRSRPGLEAVSASWPAASSGGSIATVAVRCTHETDALAWLSPALRPLCARNFDRISPISCRGSISSTSCAGSRPCGGARPLRFPRFRRARRRSCQAGACARIAIAVVRVETGRGCRATYLLRAGSCAKQCSRSRRKLNKAR